MEIQRLSDDWLFQRHSPELIKRWGNGLKYSYFKRAWGGHANDGDEFNLTLNYKDRYDLLDILKRIDIQLNYLPKNPPTSTPGQSYTHYELTVFYNPIEDVPEYEQPKHIDFNGIKCFCWIENGEIRFSVSGGQDGDPYEVSETDFETCKKLEQLITDSGLTDKVSRALEDEVTCISKTRYKNLFE
jgi:hypothetical protein